MMSSSFMELSSTEMYKIVNELGDHFRWDQHDAQLKKCVWDIAYKACIDFKHNCHKTFLLHGPDSILKDFLNGHNQCWTWMCGHIVFPRFLITNKANRGKLKNVHRLGSRPISYLVEVIQCHRELNIEDNSFALFRAYERTWCRSGPEFESFHPNYDAMWESAKRKMTEWGEAHPCSGPENAVREIEAEQEDIF